MCIRLGGVLEVALGLSGARTVALREDKCEADLRRRPYLIVVGVDCPKQGILDLWGPPRQHLGETKASERAPCVVALQDCPECLRRVVSASHFLEQLTES